MSSQGTAFLLSAGLSFRECLRRGGLHATALASGLAACLVYEITWSPGAFEPGLFALELAWTALGVFTLLFVMVSASTAVAEPLASRRLHYLLSRPVSSVPLLAGIALGQWLTFCLLLLLAAVTAGLAIATTAGPRALDLPIPRSSIPPRSLLVGSNEVPPGRSLLLVHAGGRATWVFDPPTGVSHFEVQVRLNFKLLESGAEPLSEVPLRLFWERPGEEPLLFERTPRFRDLLRIYLPAPSRPGPCRFGIEKQEASLALELERSDVTLFGPSGSFLDNLARALAGLLLEGAVLTSAALAASAAFSTPVAVLVTLAAFTAGHSVAQLRLAVLPQIPFYPMPEPLAPESAPSPWRSCLRWLLDLVPDLGRFNLIEELTEGLLVPWETLLSLAILAAVLSGALLIAGGFVLSRREHP